MKGNRKTKNCKEFWNDFPAIQVGLSSQTQSNNQIKLLIIHEAEKKTKFEPVNFLNLLIKKIEETFVVDKRSVSFSFSMVYYNTCHAVT